VGEDGVERASFAGSAKTMGGELGAIELLFESRIDVRIHEELHRKRLAWLNELASERIGVENVEAQFAGMAATAGLPVACSG